MGYADSLYDNPDNILGITAKKNEKTGKYDLDKATVYYLDSASRLAGRIVQSYPKRTLFFKKLGNIGRQRVMSTQSDEGASLCYRYSRQNENDLDIGARNVEYLNRTCIHTSRNLFVAMHRFSKEEQEKIKAVSSKFGELMEREQGPLQDYENGYNPNQNMGIEEQAYYDGYQKLKFLASQNQGRAQGRAPDLSAMGRMPKIPPTSIPPTSPKGTASPKSSARNTQKWQRKR